MFVFSSIRCLLLFERGRYASLRVYSTKCRLGSRPSSTTTDSPLFLFFFLFFFLSFSLCLTPSLPHPCLPLFLFLLRSLPAKISAYSPRTVALFIRWAKLSTGRTTRFLPPVASTAATRRCARTIAVSRWFRH